MSIMMRVNNVDVDLDALSRDYYHAARIVTALAAGDPSAVELYCHHTSERAALAMIQALAFPEASETPRYVRLFCDKAENFIAEREVRAAFDRLSLWGGCLVSAVMEVVIAERFEVELALPAQPPSGRGLAKCLAEHFSSPPVRLAVLRALRWLGEELVGETDGDPADRELGAAILHEIQGGERA